MSCDISCIQILRGDKEHQIESYYKMKSLPKMQSEGVSIETNQINNTIDKPA